MVEKKKVHVLKYVFNNQKHNRNYIFQNKQYTDISFSSFLARQKLKNGIMFVPKMILSQASATAASDFTESFKRYSFWAIYVLFEKLSELSK